MERGRKRRKIKAQEGCLVSSRLMRTKVEGGRKRRAERGASCKQETSEDWLGRGWLFNEEMLGPR